MRAERDRRATILTAEGQRTSAILQAEGEKQSAVLRAEGQRTSAILKAEGEAKAIETVFGAIHDGAPDQALLSYQYLQMLPELAKGDANKVFVIPSEYAAALSNLTSRFADGIPQHSEPKTRAPRATVAETDARAAADAEEAAKAARDAAEQAESAATPGVPQAPREIPPPPPEPEL
jgi:hypothetical protein